MMKKFALILCLAATLFSFDVASAGNPVLKKSVFEQINEEDLALFLQSEPGFGELYEALEMIPNLILDYRRDYYKDVTWGDVYECMKYKEEVASNKEKLEQWKKSWSVQYSRYDEEFDSVLTFWVRYICHVQLVESMDVPIPVVAFLANLLSDDADLYRQNAVQELISPEYVCLSQFVNVKVNELVEKKFPMELELLREYAQMVEFVSGMMEEESSPSDLESPEGQE